MALGERLASASNRFYDRMRHRDAYAAARGPATAGSFDALRGHKYCLLVTYKRSGDPIPTPVWFGLGDDGRLYVRTETAAAKVKRISHDARVRVAPANVRGKPVGTPSYEIEDFAAITDAIRAEVGEAVIINFSTGTIGVPVEKRVAYLRACRPEVAALNMGSMNYAKYSRSRRDFVFKAVFANPFEEIIELLEAMNELSIKPEHECFDVGHVGSLAPLVDMGVLRPPLHVDCVMGVVGGIPPTARNLAAMVENIPDTASSDEA